MFLLIDNVKIENRFVRILEDYPDGFLLAGEAVEEDGKKIHDGLMHACRNPQRIPFEQDSFNLIR